MFDLAFNRVFRDYKVESRDNGLDLIVYVPGVDKKDIHLSLENNRLRVRADEGEFSGEINREFMLPNWVTREGIDPEMVNGVLRVRLRKPKDYSVEIPVN